MPPEPPSRQERRLRRIVRTTLLSARDLAYTAGPFVLIALLLLLGAYFILKPQPPRRVVLATGPGYSDYAQFGKRYQQELKQHGIEVVLRPTEGSSINRRLLSEGKEEVDLGFVRGGSSEALRKDEEKGGLPLVALASLFLEPVWIFYREDAAKKLPGGRLASLTQLRELRVNTGGRGSGATVMLYRLMDANGIRRDALKLDRRDQGEAVAALFGGELDAMVLISAPEAPPVQALLFEPGVSLFEFEQAEAYSRRFSYLSPVVLPRGVADLVHDIPPRDTRMLAPTTMLVAREGTHPALMQLFVQAAHRIHGEPGWISRGGQFPSTQNLELPLARESERYFRSGPPLLQRYLPFWLANLVDRMWVALISIIAILIPLSRVVPPLYAFRVRSRIFRWYRSLRQIENEAAANGKPVEELLAELNRLDAKAERIAVPLSYTDELYNLRTHIGLVRDRVRRPK
ncbi:MAG TPA: TAXI family TRAP transporter solute-binding subunit [Burkholderiales bacterium]|nr:TAXI family TRAP transporter solute-binding subunit [Burkholderiales bacterium]